MSKLINGLSTVMSWYDNSKPAVKLGKNFIKNPSKALAATTVTSIVIKDGIGCAMYVTQSLNNKKIPDEKRKFVAALDLTNGVLMIAAQIAMFLAMRKYSGKIFDKAFNSSFNPLAKSNAFSRFRMKANLLGETVYKKMEIGKDYDAFKKKANEVFKFVLDIAAATIVGKRIIVPLIATPLAKKVEKRMNNGAEKTEVNAQKQSTDVSMQGNNASEQSGAAGQNLDTGSTNLLDKYRQK